MPWRALVPAVVAVLLASVAPAVAGNLVQVRVGNHPTYTRVVFELDSPTGYRIERHAAGESENTVVVTLQAASRVRQIQSKSVGVESVAVEPVDGQAVARIVTRESGLPIKEMILTNPPRVVLDLMLPASAQTAAAARPTPKPAAVPVPEAPAPAEEPAAATAPPPMVVAENQPDAAELAPEPAVVPAPAPRATPPEPPPAPVAVTPPSTADEMADEGESVDVAEPAAAPDEELAAAEAAAEPVAPSAEADAEMALPDPDALADAGTEADAASDAVAEDAAASEAERMAAKVAELEAERAAEAELEAELWAQQQQQQAPPGAMAQTAPPGAAAVPALEEPEPAAPGAASPLSDLDPITLGAIAGVALALLVVIVAVLRRRRALPNDMDVTAFAAADADAAAQDQPAASGGFAMDAPISDLGDPAEDFESGRAHATDDEDKPIESARAPLPGAGLFDDTPIAKDATTMQDQDMSMTQGASDAPTHLGVGSGLAGMAGDSNVASLVQELERRMTLMEQRLEEANEARERLERQVSAQSEELRVQRAAIARTQRALRGLNRSEEDQATEPALRDPADPAGRQ